MAIENFFSPRFSILSAAAFEQGCFALTLRDGIVAFILA
jgi:hypothetical protein